MHKLTNKFRKLLLSAVTIGTVGLLAGCGVSASGVEADNSGVTESQSEANGSGQNYAGSDSQKLQIVATIFPEYDWVKEILGEQADNVELTLLLGNGTDMHSFQPTMEDILKVSTCDIFIYVGGMIAPSTHISMPGIPPSLYPTTIAPLTAIAPGEDWAMATRSSISSSSIQWY